MLKIVESSLVTISLSLPHGLGDANCFLIRTGKGFILIDTGFANKRDELENKLKLSGCFPGSLGLIVLTHGDGDHCGNCVYLRQKYGAEVAIHRDELQLVQTGDAFASRHKKRFLLINKLILRILSWVVNLGKFETFLPDFFVEDGFDLSSYGLDGRVVHIPGHSKGSIGVLMDNGDLFCGDLFWNAKSPSIMPNIDSISEAHSSIEKLKALQVALVYPGHGKPFSFESLETD